MALTSKALHAFTAVAEELHFGRAAKRLHVSQPPLSQQIRQFEHDVGATLFLRTTRSVQLTPAGRLLYARAQRLIADGELALEATRRLARGETGELALGFTHSAVAEVLPRALRTFRERHADVTLELRQLTSSQLVDGVKGRRLDLALVRLPASMADPELEAIVVARNRMLLTMPAAHPLAKLRAVPIRRLDGLPLVGYSFEESRHFHEIVDGLFAHHGVQPLVTHRSFLPTLLALVEAGMGVALVPTAALPRQTDAIVARPLSGIDKGRDVATLHCIWRRDNPNPLVTIFAEVLRGQAERR